ncbi:prion-inhibition and propagation-domain-containing protein [Aspergillus varians]
MEAAGLVLSVVALFGSCLKGYQLVSDIRGVGQDYAILLCRLQIEEKRLIIWGRTAGFTDEACSLPAQDLGIVLTVLGEIHSITQDAAVMKKRYAASLCPAENTYQDRATEYIQSSTVLLDLKRRIDQKAQSSRQSLKTGLRWMFDRNNFEKLVVDLRELNNGLYALLHGSQKIASINDFSGVCFLSSAVDDVHKLATIRDASQTTYHGLSRTVDQRMHFLRLQVSPEDSDRPPGRHISLEEMTFLEGKGHRTRSIARLGEEMVLVEWREYEESESDPSIITILNERIASLSVLLGRSPKPKEFHVMDCVGYCHDEPEKRFGIIYDLPTLEIDDIPETVSLYDLIHPQSGSEKVFPSLNDRFRLAGILANSLLHLHSTKWLHRNLRSSNILFLRSGRNNDWLHEPYICGFGYSRPDDIAAISLPLRAQEVDAGYQHPDLVDNPRGGYHRHCDIYSLGVILVEIGFWRPISTFRKSTYTAKKNHRRLLEYQLTGDLAHRMGQQFEQAVKLLLTGKAYSGETEGEQLVEFLDNVVTKVDGRGLN